MLDVLSSGLRRAFDSASLPLPGPRQIIIDGYAYGGLNDDADVTQERIAAFEAYVAAGHEADLADAWAAHGKAQAEDMLFDLQGLVLNALSLEELRKHVERVLDSCRETMATHHTNGLGYYVEVGRFGLFCETELAMSRANIIQLLTGASPASREPAEAIEKLADSIRSDESLLSALRSSEPLAFPELQELIGPWIERFGYRTTAFEYDQPTLAETPDAIVRLLRNAVEHHAPPTSASEESSGAVRKAVPADKVRRFDELLDAARRAYATRDDDVSFVQWAQGLQRLAFLEAGKRLTVLGVLADAEDVWYLRRTEMEEYLRSGAISVRPDVPARKAERARQRMSGPRAVVGEALAAPTPDLSPEAQAWLRARSWALVASEADGAPSQSDRSLSGVPGSPGLYSGRACIVLDESEMDKLEPGDVLVCKMTSPSWNVVFATVGALVTDFGGQLSHPAIIAREFGIPAVVGTQRGTALIPDGVTIEVDGGAGIVRW